uniref:Uncharacterized protein n=1 Tax=Ditylum brightwellii TaxID=49249 RepID=A0A7S4SGR7_9STRA
MVDNQNEPGLSLYSTSPLPYKEKKNCENIKTEVSLSLCRKENTFVNFIISSVMPLSSSSLSLTIILSKISSSCESLISLFEADSVSFVFSSLLQFQRILNACFNFSSWLCYMFILATENTCLEMYL